MARDPGLPARHRRPEPHAVAGHSASAPEQSTSPPFILRLFGPFEARVGGEPLTWRRKRKGEWLLSLLVLRSGGEVERSWLAGTLWPESGETQALTNLRASLANLRRALGTEAKRLRSPSPRTLTLDLTGAAVDVLRFDTAIARGDPAGLAEAVALYRGPLLEGCLEPWAFQGRQAREQSYLAARERLAALALERGDGAEAERHLRLAVDVDPLRESVHRALMQALAAGGNYAAALQCYRELRLHLHRELNTEPDPQTQALFQQLRADARQRARGGVGRPEQIPCVEQPMPAEPPAAVERARPLRPAAAEAVAAEELPLFALQRALASAPMVARAAELGTLQRQIEAVAQPGTRAAGGGGTLFLAGEPGIGKTRLAAEASLYARQRGFHVLTGRCDEQGAAPFQPFIEALHQYLDRASPEQAEETLPAPVAGELVRLIPRMAEKVKDVPRVAAAEGAAVRQALAEAMGEFFALLTRRQGPVLLFLEDLHWADEGSLAMLHHLARRAKTLPLLILGTYRDLPPDLQQPLERTLAAFNRERLIERLALRRLPEAGVAELVAALLCGPPAAFVSTLYHETEGNPFFLEEVLKHLVEEGAVYREDGRWQIKSLNEFSLPDSVKAAIGRRLERLSPASREALALAAVIGQQFRFELLLQASELEEERLLEMLDQWLGAQLVIEERQGREEVYQFQHALVRDVLYDELNLRRRSRLHERVGLALEEISAGTVDEHLNELAYHFAQARNGAAMEKGVDYCLRAGERAVDLYAHDEARRHLTAALELLEELPEDDPHLRKRWDVVSTLQKAFSDCREFERAREVVQEYLDRAQRGGYPWGVAAAHCQMAAVLGGSQTEAGIDDLESSRRLREEYLERSIQIADQHGLIEMAADARLGLACLLSYYRDGSDLPRAEALLRETLQDPARVSGGFVQLAYDVLMSVCARQGKWDEVAAALRQSIPFGGPGCPDCTLGIIEEGLNRAGKQAEFIALCEEARTLYAQAGLAMMDPKEWYLKPATPSEEFRHLQFRDEFEAPELRPEWRWHAPHPSASGAGASSYHLSERPGHLTLRAGSGVDLWPPKNLNAPRLLLEVCGDFALETKMEAEWDKPGEYGDGGLLIWKDVLNFLRLEKFTRDSGHQGSVQLEGRIGGEYPIAGRGLLRGDTVYLRLERTGDRFVALCSTDGVQWLTCGQMILPVKDPLQVGVWAGGGMVVHFDDVQVLGRRDPATRPPAG